MARSVGKRLQHLEQRAREGGDEIENRASREVFRRMSTEDLLLLEQWCERAGEGLVEPNEEEGAAIQRYEELLEEVKSSRSV